MNSKKGKEGEHSVGWLQLPVEQVVGFHVLNDLFAKDSFEQFSEVVSQSHWTVVHWFTLDSAFEYWRDGALGFSFWKIA